MALPQNFDKTNKDNNTKGIEGALGICYRVFDAAKLNHYNLIETRPFNDESNESEPRYKDYKHVLNKASYE